MILYNTLLFFKIICSYKLDNHIPIIKKQKNLKYQKLYLILNIKDNNNDEN